MIFNSSKNDKIFRMNTTENHNNTNEIYENIWKCLDKGVNDRFSDYHTFSLATAPKNIARSKNCSLKRL